MMPDTKLRAAGYDFNSDRNDWSYQAPGGTTQIGAGAQDRLYRILQTSVLTTLNGELDNLSGEGIVEAWNGEYVKYKNNTIFASGNADAMTISVARTTVRSCMTRLRYIVDAILGQRANGKGQR